MNLNDTVGLRISVDNVPTLILNPTVSFKFMYGLQ